MSDVQTALIIGAGPAGLTAALELIRHTKIIPIIFEQSNDIGGISKTVNYHGYRMDMGGHRFFSKSQTVMNWWKDIFPVEETVDSEKDRVHITPVEDKGIKSFLIRNRISRILFDNKFFPYPITFKLEFAKNLGFTRIVKILTSYVIASIFPKKEIKSLEDVYINKFGKKLYSMFFEEYTKKLWGIHPSKINPDWGEQRIKGISVTKVIREAIKKHFSKLEDLEQSDTETSLIQKFMYPKLGPGQFWEEIAKQVEIGGGIILKQHKVIRLKHRSQKLTSLLVKKLGNDTIQEFEGDYVLSTMPVDALIKAFEPKAPKNIIEVSRGLPFRDFISVGLLFKKLTIKNHTEIETVNDLIPDNWIYLQNKGLTACRVQIFNNWSPYMVKEKDKIWLGWEIVCSKNDAIWTMGDKEILDLATDECRKTGIADKEDFLDGCVVKIEKAYPGYYGTYKKFDEIKSFLNPFENLFLIGRNGMHRYNNMDHSMLTAMEAVRCISKGIINKKTLWDVNTEKKYHETAST